MCLSIALAMGAAPPQGFVFCLEPNGSIALELAAGGFCGGCCEFARDGLTEPAHVREACGCVDVPLVFESATRASKVVWSSPHADEHGPPPSALTPDAFSLHSSQVDSFLPLADHERPPPLLRVLRSTVLVV